MESSNEFTSDQQAAMELIGGSPLLSGDSYAKKVVEGGGVVDSGRVVDLGDFLAARQAVLESAVAEAKVSASKRRNPEAYEVANSVAPNVEKYIEG